MPQCLKPFRLPDTGVLVPCGRCYNCLLRRSSGWSFRLNQHDKVSMSSYFVTFTYNNDKVHITDNGFMTLCKRDCQLFFKDLRFKMFGSKKGDIKYYLCGEYGGKTFRPHYHAIIFNADLVTLIGERDARFVNNGVLLLNGREPYDCPSWSHGHITVGIVTGASVGYTLKYMHKPFRVPVHYNDDRVPEFSLMSKGLGLSYLTDRMKAWHYAVLSKRMYCQVGDVKLAMPRYFKDKLYTPEEREEIYCQYLLHNQMPGLLKPEDAKFYSDIKLKISSTKNRIL